MAQMYILFRLTSVGALFIDKPICFCVEPFACCGNVAVSKFFLLLQAAMHSFLGYFSLGLSAAVFLLHKKLSMNFKSSKRHEFGNDLTTNNLTFVSIFKEQINCLGKLF